MTKDPFMAKAAKMNNVLTFLATDENEAKSLLIYLLGKMMAPQVDWENIVMKDSMANKLHEFLAKEKGNKTEWV